MWSPIPNFLERIDSKISYMFLMISKCFELRIDLENNYCMKILLIDVMCDHNIISSGKEILVLRLIS